MLATMGGGGRGRAIASATWLLAGLGLGLDLGCGGDDAAPASATDGGSSSSGLEPAASTTGDPDPSACMPGEARACYDGPPGTEGVGACAAGQQVCAADGQGWLACEGQTEPEPTERCDTPQDDDCDGLSVCAPALEWWHEVPGNVRHVAARSDGGVVLAGGGGYGEFQGALLDGGFVAQLDASGQRVWSYSTGSRWYVWPQALAVDATGAIVVAGEYDGSPDLGGGPLPSPFGIGSFAVRYLEGEHVWSHRSNGGGYVSAALGPDGTTYVVSGGNPKSSTSLVVQAVRVDGTLAWSLTGDGGWDDDTISLALAPTAQGEVGALWLVGRVVGSDVALGDMPIPTGNAFESIVVRIGLDGTPLDHRRVLDPRAFVTYHLQAFARPGGLMTAATVIQADPEGGEGNVDGVLLTALDEALEPVSQRFLGRDTWLNGIAPYPDGTTLLNVGFSNVLELGQLGVGQSGNAIALVDDQGNARWAEMLYASGSHRISSVCAAPDGSVLVVGEALKGAVLADVYVSGYFVAKLRP